MKNTKNPRNEGQVERQLPPKKAGREVQPNKKQTGEEIEPNEEQTGEEFTGPEKGNSQDNRDEEDVESYTKEAKKFKTKDSSQNKEV